MHVYQGDIKDLTEPVDLLSLSAFEYNYSPNPVTIIGAIYDQYDISVKSLSESPLMDMRSLCSCWISDAIAQTPKNPYIRRIGCVEFQPIIREKDASAETLLSRIQSYYQMLDLLPLNGVPLHNIIMPVLGAGNQSIDPGLMIVPIINEAIQ
ncbi:MAG: hypothetical protein K6C06_02635 [Lachnospiraceae bacterium]|nr:hypothetical protein [Lachnospiraceae bacterium]